jgi:hypothetical protein
MYYTLYVKFLSGEGKNTGVGDAAEDCKEERGKH